MTTARTSRESIETISTGIPEARTSRESIEVISIGIPKARTSRESIEVLWVAPLPFTERWGMLEK